MTNTPTMDMNESVTDAIVTGKFQWCRAKLLHALAHASRQGVLNEVIDELMDDDGTTRDKLTKALVDSGWIMLTPSHDGSEDPHLFLRAAINGMQILTRHTLSAEDEERAVTVFCSTRAARDAVNDNEEKTRIVLDAWSNEPALAEFTRKLTAVGRDSYVLFFADRGPEQESLCIGWEKR